MLAAEIMVVSKLVASPELDWLGIHIWVVDEHGGSTGRECSGICWVKRGISAQ